MVPHTTPWTAHLEATAHQLPNGRYHHCPNGSHLAYIDDQQTYFEGLLRFLHDVDQSS